LHGFALVDIDAFLSVAREARVAGADEAAVGVGTAGVGVASIVGSTLVNVGARLAVSEPSFVTFAGESTGGVLAGSVGIAVVRSFGALVDVIAGEAIAREAGSASASERTFSIAAGSGGVTGVGITLVSINALSINRLESRSAVTSETSREIHTRFSSSIARVRSGCALVNVKADSSVARESGVASASESTVEVFAGSLQSAVVSTSGAFVDVDAFAISVLREAFFTAA